MYGPTTSDVVPPPADTSFAPTFTFDTFTPDTAAPDVVFTAANSIVQPSPITSPGGIGMSIFCATCYAILPITSG